MLSLPLYMGGREAEEDRGDGSSVRADVADITIRSSLFWGYMRMLDMVSEVMLALTAWCQGCPCHTGAPILQGASRLARAAIFRRAFDETGCPLRTMRAAEVASGAVGTFLRRLFSSVNTSVLLDPSVAGLAPDERAIVMRDFAAVRKHVLFTFSVKLAFWNQLPWCLAGVAHMDSAIARRCARRSLSLANEISDEAWGQQHAVTTVLLCQEQKK